MAQQRCDPWRILYTDPDLDVELGQLTGDHRERLPRSARPRK
ncbi:hypothetical protein ACMTN4_00425 (plasmid) [Rhodococcus globerulus]